jgi:hypothetical protein
LLLLCIAFACEPPCVALERLHAFNSQLLNAQDDKFENRELAAIIASKVHYHLEQFDESLTYALGAGALFTDQITSGKPSQYVFTILSKVYSMYLFYGRTRAAGVVAGVWCVGQAAFLLHRRVSEGNGLENLRTVEHRIGAVGYFAWFVLIVAWTRQHLDVPKVPGSILTYPCCFLCRFSPVSRAGD